MKSKVKRVALLAIPFLIAWYLWFYFSQRETIIVCDHLNSKWSYNLSRGVFGGTCYQTVSGENGTSYSHSSESCLGEIDLLQMKGEHCEEIQKFE